MRYASPGNRTDSWSRLLFGLGVLLLPVAIMTWAAIVAPASTRTLLWIGTMLQCLATLLALVGRGNLRNPASWPIMTLYIMAITWMLFTCWSLPAAVRQIASGSLLGVVLSLFAYQCLDQSGALVLRRGRVLADRLLRRRHWPSDLLQIRNLPEVCELREVLTLDASPVFGLLTDTRLEARLAGLATLEYRSIWRPGQPEYLLHLLQNSPEPEVKAEALRTLACVDERTILEPMTECLWHESVLVRQAAADALLWNTEERWEWIRSAIRQALGHPMTANDGSLVPEGMRLGPEVVVDLAAWTRDKGLLAQRAALTLSVHYGRVLANGNDLSAVHELRAQLIDSHTPSVWRIEVARLLFQYQELTPEVARPLLDPSNPGPLRLLAIETLLSKEYHRDALMALTDLARMPNREMALAAAEIVQRRLGFEIGLARGQTLPPVHSRLAAEVVRNVLNWADRQDGRVPVGRTHDDYDY